MNWYVAESLGSIVRHREQVSSGRRSEGYELQSGTLYMHKVQLTDDEVEALRQRFEDGVPREQMTVPGVESWYLSRNGKARWPGTSIHSRCKQGPDGKWRPVPLTAAQLAQINA